ncbi:MAG: hypothetical protein IJ027_00950 [Oscillospiraceae bacterium]|nr:hypothetical protein [Oscillospiraceae bacterium]
MGKRLFVVFSATPLKMGTIIRTATGERYNHVSLSLDKSLGKMYSFARHYKSAPLYGGFVCETPARYRYKGKTAEIFVCALPISEEQYCELSQKFEEMEKEGHKYCYNLFSAALAPISLRFPIKNSFTCAEFAAQIISAVYPKVRADKFYSVDDLRQLLSAFAVYYGAFPNIKDSRPDLSYEKHIPFRKACRLTLRSGKKLVKASLNERFK